MKSASVLCSWPVAAAALLCAMNVSTLRAAPYASGVYADDGGIAFLLNEDADHVAVVLHGGTVTNHVGPLSKGKRWFALNGSADFQIVVSKNSEPGYRTADGTVTTLGSLEYRNAAILEISDPTSPGLLFNSGRGLAINRWPHSPYFGRVYVCNSADPAGGYTSNFLGVVRNNASADGIYVLNADGTDAVGQGDTARTGGLDWTTHNESPGRLFIGPDSRLYICDRGSAISAGLYLVDPDVSEKSGTNILRVFTGSTQFPVGDANTHGRVDCVHLNGSLDTADLRIYIQDADLQPNKTTSTATKRNSIWRSPSSELLSWEKLPYVNNFDLTGDKFTSPQNHQNGANPYGAASDFERGSNGFYYINIPRDDGNTFWVFDASFSGSGLFNAKNAGDTALSGYCLGLSPDSKYVAIGTRQNGHVKIYPTDSGFVPVHARRVLLPIGPGGNQTNQREREVRFDAALNMYVLQDNMGLRVFSPGGASVATTSNDTSLSNGTFAIELGPAVNPQPADSTRNVNQDATFWITADGTAPLYYQWMKDGTPLSDAGNVVGSATASLTLLAPLSCANDGGEYQVIVSNLVGVVTSRVATLTVRDPGIVSQPVNQTNWVSETARFSVSVAGSGSVAYQWQRGGLSLADGPTGWGSIIAGATSNVLSILNVSETDALQGGYSVVVSGVGDPVCSTNTVTSTEAALTVIPPLELMVAGDPTTGITLTWPTEFGKYYEVHFATEVDTPAWLWIPLYGWVGDGFPASYTDYPPSTDSRRYYRLRVQ